MSKSVKRRSLFGVDNLALDSESDTETAIYDYDENSDDCDNMSSDEFSSDSEDTDSDSDLLRDSRVWYMLDDQQPTAARLHCGFHALDNQD